MSMHPDRAQLVRETQRRQADETPIPGIGSIHRARVTSIREFGAFVEVVDGDRFQGLVHISELSQARVELVRDLVDVGELVWVKLIDVKEPARRLSFSMKYCDQGSGRDLDPNEVKLSMARSGQKAARLEPGPVMVGAVLDTTCTRCGVHGHTTKECFADLSAGRYELIPDFPDPEDLPTEKSGKPRKHRRKDDQSSEPKEHKKKKKHKKVADSTEEASSLPEAGVSRRSIDNHDHHHTRRRQHRHRHEHDPRHDEDRSSLHGHSWLDESNDRRDGDSHRQRTTSDEQRQEHHYEYSRRGPSHSSEYRERSPYKSEHRSIHCSRR